MSTNPTYNTDLAPVLASCIYANLVQFYESLSKYVNTKTKKISWYILKWQDIFKFKK